MIKPCDPTGMDPAFHTTLQEIRLDLMRRGLSEPRLGDVAKARVRMGPALFATYQAAVGVPQKIRTGLYFRGFPIEERDDEGWEVVPC